MLKEKVSNFMGRAHWAEQKLARHESKVAGFELDKASLAVKLKVAITAVTCICPGDNYLGLRFVTLAPS